MLPATLLTMLSPDKVIIGNPTHKASLAVVCALIGNVSKNKSAQICLLNAHY